MRAPSSSLDKDELEIMILSVVFLQVLRAQVACVLDERMRRRWLVSGPPQAGLAVLPETGSVRPSSPYSPFSSNQPAWTTSSRSILPFLSS